jgi:hypothetical protein
MVWLSDELRNSRVYVFLFRGRRLQWLQSMVEEAVDYDANCAIYVCVNIYCGISAYFSRGRCTMQSWRFVGDLVVASGECSVPVLFHSVFH